MINYKTSKKIVISSVIAFILVSLISFVIFNHTVYGGNLFRMANRDVRNHFRQYQEDFETLIYFLREDANEFGFEIVGIAPGLKSRSYLIDFDNLTIYREENSPDRNQVAINLGAEQQQALKNILGLLDSDGRAITFERNTIRFDKQSWNRVQITEGRAIFYGDMATGERIVYTFNGRRPRSLSENPRRSDRPRRHYRFESFRIAKGWYYLRTPVGR